MQPLYLYLEDFMLHSKSVIDFSKLSPASAIIGMKNENIKDSIAIGKTSIFHAIRYALYNAKATNNINKIIRDGTRKCKVIFDFILSDGNTYRIERGRSKTTQEVLLKIKDGDEWVSMSDRTNTLTDQKILNIIKINQETFENSSYFKQKDQFNLAGTTPSKRKEIIRQMLQLEEWSKYEEQAKAQKSKYDKELFNIIKIIENIGNPEEDIKSFELEIENIEQLLLSKNNEIETLSKSIDNKKYELEELKRNVSLEYPQLLKKLKNEEDYFNKINNDVKSLKADKDKCSKVIEQLTKNLTLSQKEISDKELLLEQLSSNMPKEVSQEYYKEVCDNIIKLKISIRENELLFKSIAKDLPADDYCPTCSTELDPDHRAKLLLKKQERLDIITDELQKDKNEIQDLEPKAKDLEDKIKDYKLTTNKINLLSNDISNKKINIKNDIDMISTKNKLLLSMNGDIESKKELLEKTKKSVNDLSDTIKSIDNKTNEQFINKLNSELKSLNSSMTSLRENHSSLMYRKGKVKNSLDTRKSDLEKYKENVEKKKEIEYQFNVYKAASVILGPSGIPAMIIHTVLGSLQDETNKVLDILLPKMQVQFFIDKERKDGSQDETLEMKFFNNGKECDFADLSGGEGEAVILALKFALCVINRKRCNADIKMLLLDEVEYSLDQNMIDAFYEVLKKWSKDMTILVITHNMQLKDKFKSFILVNNVDGVSTAEVVN